MSEAPDYLERLVRFVATTPYEAIPAALLTRTKEILVDTLPVIATGMRAPELVAKEVRQGLVTSGGARAYGVVADDDGVLDAAATTALRAEMAAAPNAANDLFDFGGDIEALRAACLAETGLPAPRPPVWTHLQAAE